jgi:uncharacterized protein
VAPLTHLFDLASLRLRSGQGQRLDLAVPLQGVTLADQSYAVEPEAVPLSLEVSRMAGQGYALRIIFDADLTGPCMRCLKDATLSLHVDAREVEVPSGGPELDSPYVSKDTVDLASWARDAFVLALPVAVLCRQDCLGLCPVCAADLNEVGVGHVHESEPDPRWEKLRELKLE